MNLNSERGNSEATFLNKMRQDAKVINNVLFILEKIESDGYLKWIQNSLSAVLNNEIVFALNELSKNDKKGKSPELKNQLINNTYIFKENLKLITNFVSGLNS